MGLSLFLSACDFSWKRQESIEKRGKVMYNRQQCDFFTEEGEEEMAKEKKKLPLAAYIFAGLVLGILAGAALMKTPEIVVEYIKPFGTLFLNLVKFIVVPIVLFSIMSGVISMQDMRRLAVSG